MIHVERVKARSFFFARKIFCDTCGAGEAHPCSSRLRRGWDDGTFFVAPKKDGVLRCKSFRSIFVLLRTRATDVAAREVRPNTRA